MEKILNGLFQINKQQTSIRTEVLAGLTTFMTVAYIIAVNGAILSKAGMPYEAVTLVTVISCFLGCMLMALWANSPLVLIPGMGDNAFFVFTLVFSLGLSWQQALAVVFIAGLIFFLTTVTKGAEYLSRSIPKTMIHSMTSGIGLFIAFLGLKNGGIIEASEGTFVQLGDLGSPHTLTTILSLVILVPLFLRNVKGNFLIGIIAGTLIGAVLGIVDFSSLKDFSFSFSGYDQIFLAFDFSQIGTVNFWTAVFSLSMVIIFQNMGAQLGMLPDKSKFQKSFQANALSVMSAGLLGCSPTTTAAESATGIAAGGKTGLTSFTTGLLFLPALFLVPLFKVIPNEAIAPVLIIVGCLMVQSLKEIPFSDFTEAFPAYLMMAIMPLSFSIANGIAFGFIAYPILKVVTGRKKEVSVTMYVIAFFFLVYFILGSL
ncbi:AGZA family xanthine/uracil permease-like MFS transporter [Bacillus sp. SORGH_AS 510]|uniref:NCS2 family permease n=1 Tax=Bacillus sp. SORGH_AS_0510 TaxID=3041771 RepID=UPI0027882AF3|nr:NCS2 family permease [Bacillus sp. SORGH_AS_0510]MDQ1146502.1 AGZA family xanthine/uracil permease-like MFS transporter [Bacillus sp. SORGH_AS_0510]